MQTTSLLPKTLNLGEFHKNSEVVKTTDEAETIQ